MENLVYWKGKPVGMEMADGRISWFTNASSEAVEALTHPAKEQRHRK